MKFPGKMSLMILSWRYLHDDIESHKNSELHPLSRKHNFGRTTGEGSNWPAPSLVWVKRIF